MKRIFACLLVLAMLLALPACGGSQAATAPAATAATTAKDTGTTSKSAETTAKGAETTAASAEKKDICDKLVICSSATDLDLEAITEGFKQVYPNVEIEIVACSAGEGVARVQAEGSNPSIDVFYSGLNQADGDKYAGIFEPYVSSYDKDLPAEYQSNNGYYNYDHLSTICLCVNTEMEKKLGLDIKGYADLLDPALKGMIVLSDPTSSSAAWNNLSNIFAVYGNDSDEAWNYLEGLLKNNMVIAGSSSACFKSVQSGEYVVGLTYEDGASTLLKSGATNIKMVYPSEGASAFAFAAAIVKNAPHMDAAKAMIEYLQSPEGQTFRANYVGTVRFTNPNVVVQNSYLPAESEIKWVKRDISWLIDNKSKMLEKWTTLYNTYANK